MRKFFVILTIVLAAAVYVACEKEDDKKDDSGIVGTWTMDAESSHYFKVSFDAKGNFDWQVLGVSEFRETGTYTKEEDVITLKTKKYYDRWDDATGTQYKDKWIEKSGKPEAGYPEDYTGNRTIKVKVLKQGFLLCDIVNDPQFGNAL